MDTYPQLIKVDSEKMNALEELARTNLLVSEGHNALEDLRGFEVDYLVEREGKVAAKIDALMEESKDLLLETSQNFEEVLILARDTRSVAGRVLDLFNAVKGVMQRFDEKSALWEKNVADREGKIEDEKKVIKLQRGALEAERKSLDSVAMELTNREKKVAADWEEVAKMFALKEVK